MASKEYKTLSVIQAITLILVIILIVDRFVTWPSDAQIGKSTPVADEHVVNNIAPNLDPPNNYIYGDKRAPNTLFVFSRYNCAFCREFYRQVLDSLLEGPVKEGQLSIIVKNLVTPTDEIGMLMAKVAEVGRQTGRFKEVQKIFVEKGEVYDSVQAIQWGMEAGIPEKELIERLNSEQTLNKINDDYMLAGELDLNATPSFLLNGRVYAGYLQFASIMNNIE